MLLLDTMCMLLGLMLNHALSVFGCPNKDCVISENNGEKAVSSES